MTAAAVLAVMALAAGVVVAVVVPASAAQDTGECHPSYDPCVPVADDVDCASGEGDGPAFIDYPVTVVGEDEYGLDAEGDGSGCEDETGTGPPLPGAPAPDDGAGPATPAAPVEGEPAFTG